MSIENLVHFPNDNEKYGFASKWKNCWCIKESNISTPYIVELKCKPGTFWITGPGHGTVVDQSVNKSFDNLEDAVLVYMITI